MMARVDVLRMDIVSGRHGVRAQPWRTDVLQMIGKPKTIPRVRMARIGLIPMTLARRYEFPFEFTAYTLPYNILLSQFFF